MRLIVFHLILGFGSNFSKLRIIFFFFFFNAAVACTMDLLSFAVLALLPESATRVKSSEPKFHERDGVILVFNVMDPVPVATWSVRKV
jgi:NET1-associated nuclear protein 1 (U3 small nucleolar RNA-associated protein 17)